MLFSGRDQLRRAGRLRSTMYFVVVVVVGSGLYIPCPVALEHIAGSRLDIFRLAVRICVFDSLCHTVVL